MQQIPWWLESGPSQCAACERHYHVEAGYLCVACDAPLCPACVRYERVTQLLLCPDCAEQEAAS